MSLPLCFMRSFPLFSIETFIKMTMSFLRGRAKRHLRRALRCESLEDRRLLSAEQVEDVAAFVSSESLNASIDFDSHRLRSKDAVSGNIPRSGVHPYFNARNLMQLHQYNLDPILSNYQGAGETVVVIGSGIDLDHPFFGSDSNNNGISDRIVYSYDFSGSNDADASETQGSGTYIASLIAASGNVFTGAAPESNLIVLKVTPDSGSTAQADVVEALNWVISNVSQYNIVAVDIDVSSTTSVYNNATVTGYASSQLSSLASANVLVVSRSGDQYYASGATQGQGIAYPSADANAISVGAVFDSNGGSISFSSGASASSQTPDAIVPTSQRTTSTSTVYAAGGRAPQFTVIAASGGSYIYEQTLGQAGTSVAAANVTGLAVLAQDIATARLGRRLTLAEFRGLLQSTGDTINDGDDEVDNVVNTGANFKRADFLALGQAIRGMATTADVETVSELPELLDELQTSLNSTVLNHELPLIGNQRNYNDNAGSQFFSAIANQIGTLSVTNEAELLSALNSRLGTTFTRVSGNPNSASNAAPVIYQGTVTGQVGATVGFAEDFGLLGLGIAMDDNQAIQLTTNYSYNLRFGITNNAFFIDTSPTNDLTFTTAITLLSNTIVDGRLGLLDVKLSGSSASPLATFTYSVNIGDANGNNDNRITSASEISFATSMVGNVNAELHIDAKFSFEDPVLLNPRLLADLSIQWSFTDDLTSSLLGGTSVPDISIDQIKLDVGEYFRSLVGPIIENIEDAAGPLFSLVEKLGEPVFPNQDEFDLTYMDVLKVGSLAVAPSTGSALDYAALVQLLLDLESNNNNPFVLLDTLASIPNLAEIANDYLGNLTIDLGSLTITDDVRQSLSGAINFDAITNSDAFAEVKDLAPSFFDSSEEYESDGASFTFDLIEQPINALKLFMGDQTAKIFSYELPQLDETVDWEYYFNTVIYVVPVTFSFQVGAQLKAQLSGGFDAKGLFDFTQSNDSIDILNGLYLDGDVPLLQLQGTAGPDGNAFVYANFGVGYGNSFSAYVDVLGIELGGTIEVVGDILTFSAALLGAPAGSGERGVEASFVDTDGDSTRVRYSELEASTTDGNWFGAFVFTGGIDYLIDAHTRLSISAEFSIYNPLTDDYETVRREIDAVKITWASERGRLYPEPPPSDLGLATKGPDGTLFLSVGSNASSRSLEPSEINEEFFVRHVSGSPTDVGGETVKVSAFGFTQVFTGVRSIVADAGDGEDTIQIDKKVLSPGFLNGEYDDDQLQLGGGGGTARGGEGNDFLKGGPAIDNLYGDGGNDKLRANEGNDFLEGGYGENTFILNNDGDSIKSEGTDTLLGSLAGGNIELLYGDDNVTITGVFDWKHGTMAGIGKTLVTSTGSLRWTEDNWRQIEREFEVQGTSLWTKGTIYMGEVGKFINRGTFTINSTTDVDWQGNAATHSIRNFGSIVKRGSGTAGLLTNSYSSVFTSSGSINVQAGRLNIQGTGSISGLLTLTGSLGLGWNSAGAARMGLTSTATVNGTGKLFVENGEVVNSSNLTINAVEVAYGVLSGTSSINITNLTIRDSGRIEGDMNVTVTGLFDWMHGTMSGTGKTLVTSTGSLRLTDANWRQIEREFEVQGTSLWTKGDIYFAEAGKFINRGTFTINNATQVDWQGSTDANSIRNFGSIIKQGVGTTGLLTNSYSSVFNSSGSINIQAGRLNVQGTGSISGAITLTGNLGLGWNSTGEARMGLTSTATVAGAGKLFIENGEVFVSSNLTLNSVEVIYGVLSGTGSINITNLTIRDSGWIDGAIDITVSGLLDWIHGTMSGTGKTLVTSTGSLRWTDANWRQIEREFEVQGTSLWTKGDIYFAEAGKFINRGTFTINNSTQVDWQGNTDANSIRNFGSIIKQGIGTTGLLNNSYSSVFISSGSISVQAGRLNVQGTGSISGAITLADSLGLGWNSTGAARMALTSTATVVGAGKLFVENGEVFVSSNLTLNSVEVAYGVLSGTGSINVTNLTIRDSGRIDGAIDVTVTGLLDWKHGTMAGTGRTLVTSTGSLKWTEENWRQIERLVEVDGPVQWTKGAVYSATGGKFISDGSWTINSNSDLYFYGNNEVNSILNRGSLVKLGAGTTTIGTNSDVTVFVSTGSITISRGVMNVQRSRMQFDGSTKLSIATGAKLQHNSEIIGQSTNGNGFQSIGTLELSGGSTESPHRLEVFEREYGYSFDGFAKPFSYGSLRLIGSHVKLIDLANNSSGAGSEAIYADQVIVDVNSSIDLNGLHIYAKSATIRGQVFNGIIQVVVANNAPVLNITGSPKLNTIIEDPTSNAGTLVSTILSSVVGLDMITDVDTTDSEGIAVVGLSNMNGRWQYTTNGSTWRDFGAVTASSSRLLASDTRTRIRFVPNANYNGLERITFRAWDRKTGTNGGIADVSLSLFYGNSNPFSLQSETATLTITSVNDAPTLAGITSAIEYTKNAASGVPLAGSATLNDVDHPVLAGGLIRVRITTGANDSNRVYFGSGVTVDGNNKVLVGAVVIGTLNTNGGIGKTELNISLNANATVELVRTAISKLRFKTVAGDTGLRRVLVSVSDGAGGTSTERACEVTVN
jgi:hypothetical protein